jgi:hypothetical protein
VTASSCQRICFLIRGIGKLVVDEDIIDDPEGLTRRQGFHAFMTVPCFLLTRSTSSLGPL